MSVSKSSEQAAAAEVSAALRHLRRADPRLSEVIRRIGPYKIHITPDPFVTLFASIVHQQLSMKAASTIRGRVKALCPRGRVTPAHIAGLGDQALRGAGLSRQKVSYMGDLCEHFLDRRLTTRGLRSMSDDQVIEATTQVYGIGRWTAEMLLIFCLKRPDVWPVDDLGVRNAVQKMLGRRKPLPMDKLRALGDPWRPYRTYASWYLWRSLGGAIEPGLRD